MTEDYKTLDTTPIQAQPCSSYKGERHRDFCVNCGYTLLAHVAIYGKQKVADCINRWTES